jgi:hypothetical protein
MVEVPDLVNNDEWKFWDTPQKSGQHHHCGHDLCQARKCRKGGKGVAKCGNWPVFWGCKGLRIPERPSTQVIKLAKIFLFL